MREQLQQYVALLFAGTQNCEDIQQEILQNTLDRYDDLIAQGKVPEAAYRLAISGIGDINEILGTPPQQPAAPVPAAPAPAPEEKDTQNKKLMRAVGVALYILCPAPLFISTTLFGMPVVGLCGLLAMVAVATALMILGGVKEEKEEKEDVPAPLKSINKIVSAIALVLFLGISFLTASWHVTWLVFPISAAVKNLIRAIYDYREERTL